MVTARTIPLRQRIVAVVADFGVGTTPRWAYGSGLLIGGRRVLTAAHTIKGATTVTVRRPTDDALWAADVKESLRGDPDSLDLAVLAVPDAPLLDPFEVAVVNREVGVGQFVKGCWSVGYPR